MRNKCTKASREHLRAKYNRERLQCNHERLQCNHERLLCNFIFQCDVFLKDCYYDYKYHNWYDLWCPRHILLSIYCCCVSVGISIIFIKLFIDIHSKSLLVWTVLWILWKYTSRQTYVLDISLIIKEAFKVWQRLYHVLHVSSKIDRR